MALGFTVERQRFDLWLKGFGTVVRPWIGEVENEGAWQKWLGLVELVAVMFVIDGVRGLRELPWFEKAEGRGDGDYGLKQNEDGLEKEGEVRVGSW
ncbi:hypothetical protein M0R45_019820 [Rubus argutus]|uniref:Uncharacterized protein n=1 Tax=Rubus argutus TaxID=59490 RepID=A0AAW1X8H3_RUBAR